MSRVRTGPLAGWDDKAGVTYERYDGLCVSLALPPGKGWAIVPSTAWAFAMPDDSRLHELRAASFASAREAAAVADHVFPPRECYACNAIATGVRTNPEIVDAEIVPPAKPTEDLPSTIDGQRWAFACAQHCDGAPELAPAPEPETVPLAHHYEALWCRIDKDGAVVAIVATGNGPTAEIAEQRATVAFEPWRLASQKKKSAESFGLFMKCNGRPVR